jgi:hypothetical protein
MVPGWVRSPTMPAGRRGAADGGWSDMTTRSAYCEACGQLLGLRPITPAMVVGGDRTGTAPHVWFHTSCWTNLPSRQGFVALSALAS